MCLLLVKPAGQSVPYQYLKNAQECNPHGSGIAFADGKTVRIEKDAKWNAEDIAERLEYLEENPVIVHFRYATHGSNTNDNTHPFKLPKRWAAAHNGIIDIKCKGDESDTRAFLRQNVVPAINHGASLTDQRILNLIGDTIGKHNKLAFLHGSGEYGIANEDCGHWNNGIWYSNYTYEDSQPYYKPFYKESLSHYRITELECCYCGREIKQEFWIDSSSNRSEMLCSDCLEEFDF